MHRFSLRDAKYLDSQPFLDAYESIKLKGRFNAVERKVFEAPQSVDFPKLRSGADATRTLRAILKMVPYPVTTAKIKFKLYSFTVSGYLLKDGSFDLTRIDLSDNLPKEKILAFFKENKFATTSIPNVVDRWFLREKYFFLRKADPKVAIRERKDEIRANRAELQKRLVSESINGRYIPRDLGDSFVQLDKELPEVERKEMADLGKRNEMIRYHLDLGMWIRNNWGLWGGSRLQKYFTDKGVTDAEEMSSVILYLYWDWLHGNKEKWKAWERRPTDNLDEKVE